MIVTSACLSSDRTHAICSLRSASLARIYSHSLVNILHPQPLLPLSEYLCFPQLLNRHIVIHVDDQGGGSIV